MSQTVSLDHFPMLAASGSIEAFISAANRVPMLSEAEEQSLARRFRDQEDLDAARQLVTSHLRLVISIARGYLGYGLAPRRPDSGRQHRPDEGGQALRSRPRRALVSFAMHWIKAEIHEYILKNWRLVKIATTKAQRKLFFNLRSIKAALARTQTRRRASTPWARTK
jgi:RNA polymerase sigma-32 factor